VQVAQEPDQASKTFVCSVVFVDLVGFSKKPVAQQIAARESLNRILSSILEPIPEEARIILDTGDGVAMSFLDNAEDALYAGMALRQRMAALPGDKTNVRIGMNIGPVKLGQDAAGGTALVGDGINAAEQIMGFAPPGQVAVSRAFYEKVSKLSDEYSNLFRYEGSRTDKHVREHEIYQLGWSDEALERASKSVVRQSPTDGAAALPPPPSQAQPGAATIAALPQPAEPWGGLIDFLEDRTKVGFAATLLAATIAALGILVYQKYAPQIPGPPLLARQDSTPAPVKPLDSAPAPVQVKPTEPEPSSKAVPQETPPAAKPADSAPKQAAPAQPPKAAAPIAQAPKAVPATGTKDLPSASKSPSKTAPAKEPEKAAPDAAKSRKPAPATDTAKLPPRKAEPGKDTQPAAPPAAVPAQPRREPSPPVAAPLRPSALSGGLVPLTRVPVDFPKEAAREGITKGTVKARIAIDAAGKVTRVDILDSRPARVFDRAVRNALARWTFAPGADNRSYEIEIDFQR
jgi:TonB family protein